MLRALLLLFLAGSAVAQPPAEKPALGPPAKLLNAADVRSKLGIAHQYQAPPVSTVKVAVLDFGFEGVDIARFPPGSTLVEKYDPAWVKANDLGPPDYQKGFEPGNSHGRLMAQALWSVAGNAADGPQFHLLNANGPTLFRRAVKHALGLGVHVILFSGHFEGGGNFDGRGSINAAVDEAVRAGVIWVNAAGNHHGRVYNGSAVPAADGFLRFGRDKQSTLRFTNRLDENDFTVVLTWNDYREREDAGTGKDLDLIVEDAAGKEIGRAALKQVAGDAPANEGESKNPRERLTLPALGRGNYRIRIQSAGGSFTATDRIRVLLSPARGEPYPHPDTGKLTDPVDFPDASPDEELYPPADNPRVLTVGEQSDYSARGPTADRRLKPELLLPMLPAKWSNGEIAGGTSYSAAYFAGVATVLKAHHSDLTGADLMRWLIELRKQTVKPVRGVMPRPQPLLWRTPTPTELAAAMAGRR